MKVITQTLEYDGTNHHKLNLALKEFFDQHPFANGFDWQLGYLWAVMTDEDAFAFCLKYPEYVGRFRTI